MAVLGVLGLDRGLLVLPPVLVGGVPVDGVLETGLKVGVFRLPTEFRPQLGGVDGVAQVMARPILDVVVGVLWLTHQFQDHLEDFLVVLLAVGPDQVGLTDLPLGQDVPDGARVVVGVDPIPDVLPRAVELWPDAAQNIGNLPRNKLLDVLVRPVVVRAVGNRRLQAKGTDPGPDKQVRTSLR